MGPAKERTILHCDLNCFFASVELLHHEDLRNVPVAVCGNPAARHGIILAKNEPAKQFGIVTAETVWEAKKKCPDLILLPPHHDQYRMYSQKVNAIYEQYTDLVEPFGIDESWLDITGSAHLFGSEPHHIADEIRSRVRRELGLTLSVGVSFNKVFAKLGSDYRKPDATTVISRENWKELVWPLAVGNLLYVGQAAQKVLRQYGVETIGQLAACSPELLDTLMGKAGRQLWNYANGLDRERVRSKADLEPMKSIGNGTTFRKDLTSRDQVRTGVAVLADSVAARLRACELYAGGVQITIRTHDFNTVSRQKQFPAPTHLMRDLTNGAMELINRTWKPPTPIRMLTVTAIHLSPASEAFEQVNLFDLEQRPQTEKREKLERTMDEIRGKFGADAIQFGKAAKTEEEET